jgi:hypothetical protein
MAVVKKSTKRESKTTVKEKKPRTPVAKTGRNPPVTDSSITMKNKAIKELREGATTKTLKNKYTPSTLSDAFNDYIKEVDSQVVKKKAQLKDLETKILEEKQKAETTSTVLTVANKKRDYTENELAKTREELSKKTLELEKVNSELSTKAQQLLQVKLEAYQYVNAIRSSTASKFIDFGFIKAKTAPVIILIILISAGVGYLGSDRILNTRISELERSITQYSSNLSEINTKYDELLANYTKSTSEYNDLLTRHNDLQTHYDLINGPKSAFLTFDDLNITLTTDRNIYSYMDPLNVTLRITKLDATPFNGKVSFKLSMGENVVTGYQRDTDGEVKLSIPSPAFKWGPGNYTLQVDSILDPLSFIIVTGRALNSTAVLIEAK